MCSHVLSTFRMLPVANLLIDFVYFSVALTVYMMNVILKNIAVFYVV